MKTFAIPAAVLVALVATPASAKMMACTAENMAKTTSSMNAMPEGPGKMAMAKEMGKANTEMSKGNMRGACAAFAKAQKAGGAK